jgi:hypothetical protein
MKGSSAAHSALVNAILAELGALPGVVIGANASGLARYVSAHGRDFAVPYGWPHRGGPDLLAAVAPLGRLIALECKTGGARPTAEQRACHEALRAVGVAVHVVRSVNEARGAPQFTKGDLAMPRVPVRILTNAFGSRNTSGAPANARSVPLPSIRMPGGVAMVRHMFSAVKDISPELARMLDSLQTTVMAAMGLVKRMPFAEGNMIEGVSLTNGATTAVPHGLGRPARGYLLCNVTGTAPNVYRLVQANTALENTQILLDNSGLPCTADVWIW